MKKAGISRRLDKLGRVVIPIEARRLLEWEVDTPIEILPFGRYILLHGRDDSRTAPVTIQTNSPVIHDLLEAFYQLNDGQMLSVLNLIHCFVESGRPVPVSGKEL